MLFNSTGLCVCVCVCVCLQVLNLTFCCYLLFSVGMNVRDMEADKVANFGDIVVGVDVGLGVVENSLGEKYRQSDD